MLPSRLFYDTLFNEMDSKRMNADIYLKDGIYHAEIDVPGFKKEDINIEIHKGTIVIKAEKTASEESEDKKYIRRERSYNKLERSFYFSDIDEENIKADFKDGTLHLVIPQKQEALRKQITIN